MKQFVLLMGLICSAVIANAQSDPLHLTQIRGQLQDSLRQQPVADATVSLLNAFDSVLLAFTRTDSAGKFSFSNLPPGRYLLSLSHVNFYAQWRIIDSAAEGATIKVGLILMKDKTLLGEVTVYSQRPPVEVNGDTLEFNAGAFKTKPNAVVEDMLKKMPGIEVDKDGTVKVNGKKINRVLVNGKDFFTGDPKLATRNLPADAVDRVQVFDKQSDQAAFTGLDDGNAEKVIDLKLKKDKKNAAFGKIEAAAGTNDRYDGQFNINKFRGDQQLSGIGMANNTDRQGFSIMDILNFTGQSKKMMGGGGGMVISNSGPGDLGLPVNGINNNQGIVTTFAGGINYSAIWNKKTDVNASYFYNDLMPANTRIVNRQNSLPGSDFTWRQYSKITSQTLSHRVNLSADHKIDSFNSVKITSVTGYQKGNADNQSSYESSEGGKILNNGANQSINSTDGFNSENTILYRHKFRKKGRTFSINGSMQFNDSRLDGIQNLRSNFYSNGTIDWRDTLNQVTTFTSVTQNYGINISYTEPLSKRSLLEFKSFYGSISGDLDRATFDYNQINGKHDVLNPSMSNAFESHYSYMGQGINMRTQKKKYSYAAGASLQYAQLLGKTTDSAFHTTQHFTNLLPSANFIYNFTKMKSLRLDYNTSLSPPSSSQLQPVKDISDPLNIKEGNPYLRPSFNHNIGLQFFNANPAKQKNLMAFINYFATQHAIVNSDVIDAAGTRTTKPVNANGVYYIMGTIDRGISLKKINTRFTFGANAGYQHSVSFINNEKNNTGFLSFTPRLSVHYTYKEIIDLNLYTGLSFNKAKYSLQPSLNNNYRRQTVELEGTVNFPAGIIFTNEFFYRVFSGRADGFNKNIALWNVALSKQVLKSKKGEIKLGGYDLLKQNIGVDRNANGNYVEDIQYLVLQRFFTLGFTYNLQKPLKGGPQAVIRTF